MFQWIKKGIIYNPVLEEGRPYWRWNYAQGQNALEFPDYVRVYFCSREKPNQLGQTVSRVSYVDLDKSDLTKVIKVSSMPVMELGGTGAFDEFGTYPFSPIRYGNEIYGYYGGVTRCESVPFNVSIGSAISKDNGETFQKLGPGPVLTHSLDEPFVVCSPKVRIFDNKWYMFYSAGKAWTTYNDSQRPEICYKLRMAVSDNGIVWEKLGKDIIKNRIDINEAQACGDVIYENGKYHMFFCYRNNKDFRRNKDNSYRIGYAFSYDLINWTRDDDKVGINISDNEQEWDSEMVAYPNVFKLGDKIYMLYLGNEVGKYGFGLAELDGDLK